MAPTAGLTHDLTIADADGTTNKYGFMLYRGRNGGRPYNITDAQTIAPRVLTQGELTQSEFPSQYAVYWYEEDWKLGIGGQDYRNHPGQLGTATMIDATAEGRLRPARNFQNSTVDINPSVFQPAGFAKIGTQVWTFFESQPYAWDFTTKGWDRGTEPKSGSHIFRNGVTYDNRSIVPSWTSGGDGSNYIHKLDVDPDWIMIDSSSPPSTSNAPKYLTVANGQLWGGYWGNTAKHMINSTRDPTNSSNWSNLVEIGEADAEITALVADGEVLNICKTNGVWAYYPDGTYENLTPTFESMTHPDHFRGAFNWNGHLLLPLGAGGLMDLFEGNLFDVSPRIYIPDQSIFHGQVVAVSGEPTRVYILIQDTANTKYHLLMAEWAAFEGRTDFRWHHVGETSYTTGTTWRQSALYVEAVTSGSDVHRRVWVGVDSTGSNIRPNFLPGDTDAEDGYSKDSAIEAVTVEYDAQFAQVDKTFAEISFQHKNLGAAGRQWTISYRVDKGAWTTDLKDSAGNADGIIDSTTSPEVVTFPDGTTGKVLELKFVPTSTSATTTAPEIESFRVTAQLRFDRLRLMPLQLYVSDGQRAYNGAWGGGKPKAALAQLRTWQGAAPEVTVVNPEGTSRKMVFLPGQFKIDEIRQEYGRRPEYLVTCVLAEV